MVNCAVPACKNDSRRQTKQNSNVTFHRFPRNEELLRKWVDALQRADWEPTIRSFVCSDHFPETSMYFSKSGLRKLIQDAVPELNLDNVPQKHKKRKRKTTKVVMPYMYVADKESVKENSKNTGCPVKKKLKKRIINLTKLSKRRRLRCNALYASLNRIKKKVSTMQETMQEFQKKVFENSELNSMLEACGVSTTELFKGLWKREKSCSPEPQEEEEFLYSEIPKNIENYVQNQPKITIYTTSTSTEPFTELDVQVSVVKSEYSPRAEPEPVFINTNTDVCRGCQLEATLVLVGEELRGLCERLVGLTREPDMLCRQCVVTLQCCRNLADSLHANSQSLKC